MKRNRHEVLIDADAHKRLKALKRLTGMPVQVAASDLIREGLKAREEVAAGLYIGAIAHRETAENDGNDETHDS